MMDKPSKIDSTKELCYSFRKKGDLRNGKLLNFSNMLKGYPFEFLGQQFQDSECAYISGCYTSNNEHCLRIQQELSVYDKGGYNAKAEYRKANVEKSLNTPHIRPDWNNFNFQWMLLALWYKVNSNPDFRNMLMQIPLNAHIIEDTSYHKGHTATIWGCKNKDLTKLRQAKRSSLRTRLHEKGVFKLKTLSSAEQIIDNRINNVGTWIGQNATGKALKLCQIAIAKNELPPIDFELLNSSNIYWFGKKIEIYVENNQVKYRFQNQITTKVIIAGGRKFANYELLCNECDNFLIDKTNVEIVSGGARGADRLGEQYATERGYQLTVKNADWRLKGGGIIRNKEMADYADAAIIFWDGKSKGTKNMITESRRTNLELSVIKYR